MKFAMLLSLLLLTGLPEASAKRLTYRCIAIDKEDISRPLKWGPMRELVMEVSAINGFNQLDAKITLTKFNRQAINSPTALSKNSKQNTEGDIQFVMDRNFYDDRRTGEFAWTFTVPRHFFKAGNIGKEYLYGKNGYQYGIDIQLIFSQWHMISRELPVEQTWDRDSIQPWACKSE